MLHCATALLTAKADEYCAIRKLGDRRLAGVGREQSLHGLVGTMVVAVHDHPVSRIPVPRGAGVSIIWQHEPAAVRTVLQLYAVNVPTCTPTGAAHGYSRGGPRDTGIGGFGPGQRADARVGDFKSEGMDRVGQSGVEHLGAARPGGLVLEAGRHPSSEA